MGIFILLHSTIIALMFSLMDKVTATLFSFCYAVVCATALYLGALSSQTVLDITIVNL